MMSAFADVNAAATVAAPIAAAEETPIVLAPPPMVNPTAESAAPTETVATPVAAPVEVADEPRRPVVERQRRGRCSRCDRQWMFSEEVIRTIPEDRRLCNRCRQQRNTERAAQQEARQAERQRREAERLEAEHRREFERQRIEAERHAAEEVRRIEARKCLVYPYISIDTLRTLFAAGGALTPEQARFLDYVETQAALPNLQ